MRRFILAGGLCASACFNVTIAADDYDRACTVDTDCVSVGEGNLCEVCGPCPNAAIALAEQSRFEADRDRLRAWCAPKLQPACAPCLVPVAVCVSTRCELRPTP